MIAVVDKSENHYQLPATCTACSVLGMGMGMRTGTGLGLGMRMRMPGKLLKNHIEPE